ncbi:MAG: diaminopimelate decarboxylase [Proteobacteria bacterium]|nr:diaminopimelate decarboxylase [Pseudomonadota bacterium]
MHHFSYKEDDLYCEDVEVKKISDEVGTPFFLYSHATLIRHFEAFDHAFAEVPHIVSYSVKANSNLAVLRLFSQLGGGADIVSGGELFRAIKAGVDPGKIVYSGVGKREDEMEYALKEDILMFNVESHQELERLNCVAGKMGKKARVALRVNPDVDPKTHPYISTGLKQNKFGIPVREALNEYHFAASLENIQIVGVDCHIGSQLTQVQPFIDALKKVKALILELREEGIDIKYLDLGGGLGITYDEEAPPHPTEYGKAIIEEAKELDLTLVFEPGRVIVGNAGILVSKVLYTKRGEEKNFIIADAAMNDLARPSLYGSYQKVVPVRKNKEPMIVSDVVGPICESGDFLAKDRELPPFKQGDLLAVMSAGAYGFTMSSNYNSRVRAAEVMVKGDSFEVIRDRETFKDLVNGERIPDFL